MPEQKEICPKGTNQELALPEPEMAGDCESELCLLRSGLFRL